MRFEPVDDQWWSKPQYCNRVPIPCDLRETDNRTRFFAHRKTMLFHIIIITSRSIILPDASDFQQLSRRGKIL